MNSFTLRSWRLLVPLLFVALAVFLTVRDDPPKDTARPAPPNAPTPAAAAEPPVLVGRAPVVVPAASALTVAHLKRLAESDRATAWDAARQVVREGRVAAPFLVRALASKDGDVASGARSGLVLIPRAAVPALVARLDDPEPGARLAVLGALAALVDWWAVDDLGADVVARLATVLARGEEPERRVCVRLVGASGRHAGLGVKALVGQLREAEGEYLSSCVFAVSKLRAHSPALRPVLVDRLLDVLEQTLEPTGADEEQVAVFVNALGALGPLSSGESARVAAAALRAPSDVRHRLVWLLGAWGAASTVALPDLEQLLQTAPDSRGAIHALVGVPGGELTAARHLVAHATRPVDRFRALGALSGLGARFEVVLPWLVEVARTGEGAEREAAVRALGFAPPELFSRARNPLLEAFRSDDDDLRLAAAWALLWREVPSPGEEELAAAALEDPNAKVRHVGLLWFSRRSKDSRNEVHAALVAPLLGGADPEDRFWAGNVLADIGTAPKSALAHARENLLHEERLVRLGASRALTTLGLDAADAAPEMIEALLDTSRDTFALSPLAASGVFDDRVLFALRRYLEVERFGPGSVLGTFGERAAVFETELRRRFLEDPKSGKLYQLAKVTRDPQGFADWLLANEEHFSEADRWSAFRALGSAGLPMLVEGLLEGRRGAEVRARTAAGSLGEEALPVLLEALRDADAAGRTKVLGLLVEAAPKEAAPAFAEALTSEAATLRAAGALGLAAAFRAGLDPSLYVAALEGRLDDEDAAVRDAAWQARTSAGGSSGALRARAEAALRDPEARVRVAAAEALLGLGGNRELARLELQAVLDVPAATWGWIGGGGTPARKEAHYSPAEALWARAGRALAGMGEAAAPAAETVVWAAIRHGEPRMQRILLGAVLAMGPKAEPVLPLLDRLASTRGTWLGLQETIPELTERLESIYQPFGRKVPHPPEDVLW